jgi:hypothetical protein
MRHVSRFRKTEKQFGPPDVRAPARQLHCQMGEFDASSIGALTIIV